jgi:hypothetical protein
MYCIFQLFETSAKRDLYIQYPPFLQNLAPSNFPRDPSLIFTYNLSAVKCSAAFLLLLPTQVGKSYIYVYIYIFVYTRENQQMHQSLSTLLVTFGGSYIFRHYNAEISRSPDM